MRKLPRDCESLKKLLVRFYRVPSSNFDRCWQAKNTFSDQINPADQTERGRSAAHLTPHAVNPQVMSRELTPSPRIHGEQSAADVPNRSV